MYLQLRWDGLKELLRENIQVKGTSSQEIKVQVQGGQSVAKSGSQMLCQQQANDVQQRSVLLPKVDL